MGGHIFSTPLVRSQCFDLKVSLQITDFAWNRSTRVSCNFLYFEEGVVTRTPHYFELVEEEMNQLFTITGAYIYGRATHGNDVSLLITLLLKANISCSPCQFWTKSLVMSTIQEQRHWHTLQIADFALYCMKTISSDPKFRFR